MIRNFRRNCFEFNKNIVFKIDFFNATNHAKLFATTFDDNVNKTRREKFFDAIVYWTIHYIIRTCLKMNKSFIFSKTTFRYNIVCRIFSFDYRRNVDDATILIDFLLISSNVNFLSFFYLKSYCIQIVKNSFYIKVSSNYANRFNRFDVFDLWLLLWIIENSKRLTFIAENVNEIEWLKSRM